MQIWRYLVFVHTFRIPHFQFRTVRPYKRIPKTEETVRHLVESAHGLGLLHRLGIHWKLTLHNMHFHKVLEVRAHRRTGKHGSLGYIVQLGGSQRHSL